MFIKPLHDRIIVQRLEESAQGTGAIHIPDSAKEKPQHGRVVAAGNGRVRDDGERAADASTAFDEARMTNKAACRP